MNHLWNLIKSHQDLLAQGVSPVKIKSLLASGELTRLGYGVYISTPDWLNLRPRDQCCVQNMATLKTNPTYVLSHVSAALMWEAPLLALPRLVWVSAPGRNARSRKQLKVHSGRTDICRDAQLRQGVLVTDPYQTVLDCTQTLPLEDALCIADYMLHRGYCRDEELSLALKNARGRGARLAREVARRMSAAAESPAETLTRNLLLTWGVQMPQEQADMWVNGHRYRPDFLWEAQKVILEVDGEVKYSGAYGDPVDVIQAEHRRQRDLERAGYTVIRMRWRDIRQNPEQLRYWLRRAGID